MVKQRIADEIQEALRRAVEHGKLPPEAQAIPRIEKPRDPKHGDYATNVAMTLAKPARKAPIQIAEAIVEYLPTNGLLAKAEVAAPGFINLTLAPDCLHDTVRRALDPESGFGRSQTGDNQRILLEYVSANPTGPLHVGHGRWAAIGSTLANLMGFAGYRVHQEFYINDAGNQMLNLGRSVLYRMEGREIPSGEEGKEFYGGAYIKDLAEDAVREVSLEGLSEPEKVRRLTDYARDRLLAKQQQTLGRLKVRFDQWFSETTLHQDQAVQKALDVLKERGYLYEKEGALWLRSTDFGDDKDRVVVRENGMPTYLAADVAYHWNKLERQFDTLINIWGADHHGYVSRVKAAIQALGYPAEKLEVIIGQLVSLYRGGEPVRMSKRTGEMVTLDEVIDEVGADAARFFLIMRSADTPLDFDLELAKKESSDNPVFYVQYAHARISSILRLASEQGFEQAAEPRFARLTHEDERALMLRIASFSDEVAGAALAREPHRLARYCQDLATDFHQFYTNCRVLNPDDGELTQARLALAIASRNVLRTALVDLLGVSAPERM